jgi:DNA-binding MarR family transcriptional regulator
MDNTADKKKETKSKKAQKKQEEPTETQPTQPTEPPVTNIHPIKLSKSYYIPTNYGDRLEYVMKIFNDDDLPFIYQRAPLHRASSIQETAKYYHHQFRTIPSLMAGILYYLYKNDELTLKELMDICLEDKASLSRATSYLEKNGFITCDSNQKKRYNNFFKLTDLGNNVAKGLSDKIDNILDLASDGFNNEEREVLYKCLTIISGNLDKICNDY